MSLVSCDPVRAHLAVLRQQGVGVRAIADAADVPRSTVSKVLSGQRQRISSNSSERILAMDAGAVADGARIDSRPTRRLILEMVRAGYTRGELARRLGRTKPELEIPTKLRAGRAFTIERLHREVMAEVEKERSMRTLCQECGHSHARADRVRALARMAGCDPDVIAEAWPCWYGSEKGRALLLTDLSRMRRAA